ncbi:torsin family 4, member Ab isoform X1 [Salvelinus namaycush]|uniref:Torsin family 4, member Ab isoform X1 n=2 Tax=Salvelinus namaycush TaxID=8040 RepID=A0A8U1BPT7_SALNM|nr:torsin family 4, member Ab isoform X1 [Salvelinus namaycush]
MHLCLVVGQMGDKEDSSGSFSEEAKTEEQKAKLIHPRPSLISPELKAMIRIRTKYQALKRRRLDSATGLFASGRPSTGPDPSLPTASGRPSMGPGLPTAPEIFTSNVKQATHRRRRRKGSRVLFPNNCCKVVPSDKDRSRAKPFFVLFGIIVSLQVYNAIENLDDHVAPYDLEGLDKTLRREVFGQRAAIEELMEHLQGYLSTYAHSQPLALALHGPSGVGKSHLGRLLVRHFRSVLGEDLVVQYFTLHHCPVQGDVGQCARELSLWVEEVVEHAEAQEKIPVFVLDEVELMPAPLLDVLQGLLQPNQTNEHLNVIYVLLSSLGQEEIIRHILQNVSCTAKSAGALLRRTLAEHHPLWAEVGLDIVSLTLLEKSHVMECLLEEMTQEGFYPDHGHIERLAGELSYFTTMGHQYSQNGCKQVVARVNLL